MESSARQKKQIALIGIPLDRHSSFLRGAAEAPAKIREAFHCPSSNTWSEGGRNIGSVGWQDLGNIDFDQDDPFAVIEKKIDEILSQGIVPIALGGDHAVTLPVMRAVHRHHPVVHILHLDAHPDLYHELGGDPFSHACPFARIMEEGLAQRLVQVGVRTANGHQQEQAKRFGVETIDMVHLEGRPVLRFDLPLYISFDMDVLDPAFAPGVSHFAPGGISTREAIRIIQKLEAPVIVGADIVEYNPRRDNAGMTAMVAAKILKELADRIQCTQRV